MITRVSYLSSLLVYAISLSESAFTLCRHPVRFLGRMQNLLNRREGFPYDWSSSQPRLEGFPYDWSSSQPRLEGFPYGPPLNLLTGSGRSPSARRASRWRSSSTHCRGPPTSQPQTLQEKNLKINHYTHAERERDRETDRETDRERERQVR